MATRRNIVKIDEEKCNGCGLCVPACAEGALQIIDGKARLVSEVYCDGLGACLGECPQDAITIEERDVEEFDAEAVEHHLAQQAKDKIEAESQVATEEDSFPRGCPGTMARTLEAGDAQPAAAEDDDTATTPSLLRNWPVQLRLVPVFAPYFDGSKLLIAADCVPFAFADFHRRLLPDRTLVVGCPKLGDTELYHRKLTQIFKQNSIQSIEVAHMVVPCCFGLALLVQLALKESGKDIPLTLTRISIRGEICETAAGQQG